MFTPKQKAFLKTLSKDRLQSVKAEFLALKKRKVNLSDFNLIMLLLADRKAGYKSESSYKRGVSNKKQETCQLTLGLHESKKKP